MSQAPFVLVIAPGRYDAPDDAVRRAREDAAAFADIIAGTEATGHPFDLDGWNVTQGHGRQGESFVATRADRFKLVASGVEQITPGGGHGRFAHPTYVPWQIVRDLQTGYLLIIIGAHLRAHLWPNSRHWRPGNLRAWWQGLRGIRRLAKDLHRKYPRAALAVVGDPNATHWQFFVDAVAKTFPKAKTLRSGAFSSGLLRGLRVLDVESIDPGEGSDHPWRRIKLRFAGGYLLSNKPDTD